MKSYVLTGSRAEIVEKLFHIEGEVFEAIVHVVESPPVEPVQPTAPLPAEEEDMFAEMRPLMVDIDLDDVDFCEAIYTRYPGE